MYKKKKITLEEYIIQSKKSPKQGRLNGKKKKDGLEEENLDGHGMDGMDGIMNLDLDLESLGRKEVRNVIVCAMAPRRVKENSTR